MYRPLPPQGYLKAGHDHDFKLTKKMAHKKAVHASSYADMPTCHLIPKKKQFRNKQGEVVLPPPNFLTMCMKSGRVQRRDPVEFGGVNTYTEDDYTAGTKKSTVELARHHRIIKFVHEDKPFYHRAIP